MPRPAPFPQPAPHARRSHAGIVAASLLVTLIAVVATVAVVLHAPTSVTPQTVAAGTAPTAVAPVADPSVSSAADPDPQGQLRRQASEDSSDVEATAGSWVPQLSSKKIGMVAEGRTWDAAAVLAEHRQLRADHPQARLVWSGDFTTFTGASFWVTVVADPSTTAAGATAWCTANGFDTEHCYAKRLAHTGGPNGNTVRGTGGR